MCNRYGHWASVDALRRMSEQLGYGLVTTSATDNLPPQENIYPDQDGPFLRPVGDKLELVWGRWGLPPFREFDHKGRRNTPRNNIRQVQHWLRERHNIITAPEHRCLVPFSAFAEPVRDSTWFEVRDAEVGFFAGVWLAWSGERLKEQPGKTRRVRKQGDWDLYAFLTTEANDVVAPIHPDAMPVILTEPEECREWLAGGEESLRLQRPYPDAELMVRPL